MNKLDAVDIYHILNDALHHVIDKKNKPWIQLHRDIIRYKYIMYQYRRQLEYGYKINQLTLRKRIEEYEMLIKESHEYDYFDNIDIDGLNDENYLYIVGHFIKKKYGLNYLINKIRYCDNMELHEKLDIIKYMDWNEWYCEQEEI